MIDPEFETLMRHLTQQLRLRPTQRQELHDELRDHFESRRDELLAEGLSREDAVRTAIADFGDAVELSGSFVRVTRLQHRRFLMRITAGSTVAAAALLLIVTAFLPSTPNTPLTTTVQAQSAGAAGSQGGDSAAMHPIDPGAVANHEVEELLETRVAVQFDDVPLKDALEYLSETAKVDILISNSAIEQGMNVAESLTLRLQHREIPVRAALDLLLTERGLSFTVKDGIVRIVGADQSSELAVYPIRDLALKIGGIGHGGPSAMTGSASAPAASTADQPKFCTRSLAELITETVESESWTAHGGPGTIMEYNGLLVVNHRPVIHAQIRRLLQMLRTAEAQ